MGVDRDPLAHELAAEWVTDFGDRISLTLGTFSRLDDYAADLDGVVLDLGVSSMQLDLADRGFSFMKDGPLDMRMSQDGPTAAEFVNGASVDEIADVLFHYGEERQSRKIASAIVMDREKKGPVRDDIAACKSDRAVVAAQKAGSKPPCDPHVPGHSHSHQRRIRRVDRGA